jgi:hypothetical protein
MSCWVVPTIAAELWGVPVQQVFQKINAGQVPSKYEKGFTFVDVAPESPVCAPAQPLRPPEPPPPTFRVVSREEIIALVGEAAFADDVDLGDWRIGRSEAGRMRRPPIAMAA